ncbi:serine hydrolase domain-containing protein [Marinobacter sp.]|uniref:serine hydrolase domain-containing protein n=1 Tax=Marinobacter sp. TaxID=50741 RepID=UPI00356A4B91
MIPDSLRRILTFTGLLLTPAVALASVSPENPLEVARFVEDAQGLDRLHSVLVAVEGEPVLAEVLRGPALDEPVNIKSLSKTVMAALVGVAVRKGVFEGPDQPIAEVVSVPSGADERVGQITVGHLLSMQAGLQRTSGQHYGPWVNSSNWVDHALTRPFVDEPGGDMLYSTGSYHILSAALTETTGQSTLALARSWLGEPLNITIPSWPTDPQGIYFGGNDMRLSPMALLAIGELYRNDGRHGEMQVLPQGWVSTSWKPRGMSRYTDDRYGYGWFVTELGGYDAYYGRGYGGQMLYVVPELAVTAVMTSDPAPPSVPSFTQELDALMERHILPAVEKRLGN